jgi:hypothetical protein
MWTAYTTFLKISTGIAFLIALYLLFMWGSAIFSAPEEPGTINNPSLAKLIDNGFQKEIQLMNSRKYPGLIPEGGKNAQLWLTEIREIITQCKGGPRNTAKHNSLRYHIGLQNGEWIKDIHTGERCVYSYKKPLIMRVMLVEGRVTEAFTDGRERTESVGEVVAQMDSFAQKVIRVDYARNRNRYFAPLPQVEQKTQQQIDEEWNRVK